MNFCSRMILAESRVADSRVGESRVIERSCE